MQREFQRDSIRVAVGAGEHSHKVMVMSRIVVSHIDGRIFRRHLRDAVPGLILLVICACR